MLESCRCHPHYVARSHLDELVRRASGPGAVQRASPRLSWVHPPRPTAGYRTSFIRSALGPDRLDLRSVVAGRAHLESAGPVNDPARDRVCLERLGAGDTSALDELYDRHGDLLYSLAVRIVGRAAEAEEVVQETWVQAWRKAAQFDPARGSVGAWLVTIVRSRALDRLRSTNSRSRAELAAGDEQVRDAWSPSGPDAAHLIEWRQMNQRVGSALTQLDQHHREVLELAYFTGLSQSEIAERLETPLGTIKSWTRQALQRLRALVPQEEWT